MTLNNVLVVYKKSTQQFYEESRDPEVKEFLVKEHDRYQRSHENNQRAIEKVLTTLDALGVKYDAVWRANMQDVNGRSLVIAVGGDGTVLEASHHLRTTPLLGVNSDPGPSVGFYDWTTAEGFQDCLEHLDEQPRTTLRRLELTLEGKLLPERALNDILIAHVRPPAMWRYRFEENGATQHRRDSGLLISAPGGSGAWSWNVGGEPLPLDSDKLLYHFRDIRGEKPHTGEALRVKSFTRTARLWIDGEHVSYGFGLGHELSVATGSPITIIGNLEERRVAISRRQKL